MVKVLIVEDQRMAREYMESYIQESDDYELAASISNAAMAEIACMQHEVDLILMDVCTENDESGLMAAEKLKKKFKDIKIIIITSMLENEFIQRAKDIGVNSFWYKDFGKNNLLSVMDLTMKGESVFPDKAPEIKIGYASSYEFTERELEVLRSLVEGYTYKEIAEELDLSPETVKSHIRNMLNKTGFTSKTKLAVAVSNKKMIITGF